MDSTYRNQLPAYARAEYDVFAMARDGAIIQRQHCCHYGDTICHPRSGYVTTKLHGTSTADATIMRYYQRGLFSCLLSSPYAAHVNLAVAKHWPFMPVGFYESHTLLTCFIRERANKQCKEYEYTAESKSVTITANVRILHPSPFTMNC